MQHLEQLLPLAALLHGGWFFSCHTSFDTGFIRGLIRGLIRVATPFSRLSRQAKNTGDLFERVVCDLLYEPKSPRDWLSYLLGLQRLFVF